MTAAYDGEDARHTFGLFALADGMGGHQAGEVASSIAARTAAHHIVHQLYLPALVQQEHSTDQPALNEVLVNAVQAANRAVASRVPGGGTTLTCALLLGPRAYIAHVGDSRAYLRSDATIDRLTNDHSLVNQLVEIGQLTAEQAAVHPRRNILCRAVGQGGALRVDVVSRRLFPGDRILLCSDGLWGLLPDDQIWQIVDGASTLPEACDALVAQANASGGTDNISAILLRMDDFEP